MLSIRTGGMLWAAFVLSGTGLLRGQAIISAQAGLIHYVQGEIYLDGKPFERLSARLRLLKTGGELRTGRGRAEIILHPGELPFVERAFIPALAGGDSPMLKPGATLRLGRDAALRMLDNHLERPQFELLSGSAILDLGHIPKGAMVCGLMSGAAVRVSKSGLYRFDVSPPRVSVYKGEAKVEMGGHEVRLSSGICLPLGTFQAEPFDVKIADSLVRWNQWRANVISQSNLAVVRQSVRRPSPERRRPR